MSLERSSRQTGLCLEMVSKWKSCTLTTALRITTTKVHWQHSVTRIGTLNSTQHEQMSAHSMKRHTIHESGTPSCHCFSIRTISMLNVNSSMWLSTGIQAVVLGRNKSTIYHYTFIISLIITRTIHPPRMSTQSMRLFGWADSPTVRGAFFLWPDFSQRCSAPRPRRKQIAPLVNLCESNMVAEVGGEKKFPPWPLHTPTDMQGSCFERMTKLKSRTTKSGVRIAPRARDSWRSVTSVKRWEWVLMEILHWTLLQTELESCRLIPVHAGP